MYYILFGKKIEVMVSFDCPCAVHFNFLMFWPCFCVQHATDVILSKPAKTSMFHDWCHLVDRWCHDIQLKDQDEYIAVDKSLHRTAGILFQSSVTHVQKSGDMYRFKINCFAAKVRAHAEQWISCSYTAVHMSTRSRHCCQLMTSATCTSSTLCTLSTKCLIKQLQQTESY